MDALNLVLYGIVVALCLWLLWQILKAGFTGASLLLLMAGAKGCLVMVAFLALSILLLPVMLVMSVIMGFGRLLAGKANERSRKEELELARMQRMKADEDSAD